LWWVFIFICYYYDIIGGTKWGLRFLVLEKGRIAYYRTHRDIAPRYVLVLYGCAVRDEGIKYKQPWMESIMVPRNSNQYNGMTRSDSDSHVSQTSHTTECLEEEQDHRQRFYVFSIYQRPKRTHGSATSATSDEESEITPLLRFSTESKAEQKLWIDCISEACAYCESDAFVSLQHQDQPLLLDQLPASRLVSNAPGRLPPIFFGKPRIVPFESTSQRQSQTLTGKGKRYQRTSISSRVTHLRSTYPPSRPMHQSSNPSYLSTESEEQNFRGLLNLAFIMLVLSHFQILMQTIQTQGFFVTKLWNTIPVQDILESPLEHFPFVTGMALLPLFVVYGYVIEKRLSHCGISEQLGMGLHFLNVLITAVVPLVITWCFIPHPMTGATLCITSTITWMKLLSYALANCDYRTSKQDSYQATLALLSDLEEGASDLSYPHNVTLSNSLYFWFAPTLVYQMAYPKSPKIRWTKVLGIILRLVIAMAMLLFLCAQILVPNLDILTEEYRTHGRFDLSASLMNLALGSTYTWLLFFYTYFHLGLNLLAELLRFGDRVFYKDWWNASEVSSYWRLWNVPVHYWLIRHVYFPCIRMRMSKNAATFVVFFVSAVIHEVLISIPFHLISYWSFFGMMGQLPLITFTKYFDSKFQGSSIGNVIFWLSFCVVGQPMAILLYAIDFWDKNSDATTNIGQVVDPLWSTALNTTCGAGIECDL